MSAAPADLHPDAERSAQADMSLFFGILSLGCLCITGSIPAIVLGIPAIVLGMLAIATVNRSNGAMKGKGLGIAGIVTGGVGALPGLLFWVIPAAMGRPALSDYQDSKLHTQRGDILALMTACHAYAADNDGIFPPDLSIEVIKDYLDREELPQVMLSSPRGRSLLPYLYRPGLTFSSPPNEPIIASPESIGRLRVVGYVSNAVKRVPEAEFQATIRQTFEGGHYPASAH